VHHQVQQHAQEDLAACSVCTGRHIQFSRYQYWTWTVRSLPPAMATECIIAVPTSKIPHVMSSSSYPPFLLVLSPTFLTATF
jgi:hypothetical protein